MDLSPKRNQLETELDELKVEIRNIEKHIANTSGHGQIVAQGDLAAANARKRQIESELRARKAGEGLEVCKGVGCPQMGGRKKTRERKKAKRGKTAKRGKKNKRGKTAKRGKKAKRTKTAKRGKKAKRGKITKRRRTKKKR